MRDPLCEVHRSASRPQLLLTTRALSLGFRVLGLLDGCGEEPSPYSITAPLPDTPKTSNAGWGRGRRLPHFTTTTPLYKQNAHFTPLSILLRTHTLPYKDVKHSFTISHFAQFVWHTIESSCRSEIMLGCKGSQVFFGCFFGLF